MFYSFSLCVHLGSGAISSARVQWWWHAIIRISAAAVCGVRGNGWRRVGAGFVDAEEGRRRGARAEQLVPSRASAASIGSADSARRASSGRRVRRPRAPAAPEQAGPGRAAALGAGAAEADEDLEEQVVG